jgi:hypothetical protein
MRTQRRQITMTQRGKLQPNLYHEEHEGHEVLKKPVSLFSSCSSCPSR